MTREPFKPDFPTETIEEGRVKALVPMLKAFRKQPSDYAPSKAPVFYNPVMELNRDLAVLALQVYQRTVGHRIAICEPLTSTGLRGMRFAAEVGGARKIVIGDINQRAFHLARHNVHLNGLDEKVKVKNEEANLLLNKHGAPRRRFDAIDIDPFGSPTHFVESALRALRNGGLLALTATDMAPLCGVHPRACVRKYGGRPLRTEYCHELAVRMVAGSVAVSAARHDMGVNVVFSHRAEHYVRVYMTVEYGAQNADESLKRMGYVVHCFKCLHRETLLDLSKDELSRNCKVCGSRLATGGPLWLGGLFDAEFCRLMEEEANRRKLRLTRKIRDLLAIIRTETDAPLFYFVIDRLCSTLGVPVPPTGKIVETLRNEGFHASLTHFNPKGIRSNAPALKIGEVVVGLVHGKS